jgi:chromosome segregation ATPase
LKRHIERYDADIERLTQDKEVLIERLNDLSQSVAQKIDEIEEMELLIKDKDKIIDLMNKKIRDKQSRPVFQMPKGDLIDQMLGHYINQANCPVPIRKIGNGFYLFGTKKIFAKILNGKLVIRVGGGFMIIEEFIATYADAEMNKIQKMSEEQLMALGADSSEMTTSINPNARLSMYRA